MAGLMEKFSIWDLSRVSKNEKFYTVAYMRSKKGRICDFVVCTTKTTFFIDVAPNS